jgi:uncharacterized protein (TIGR02722 family)
MKYLYLFVLSLGLVGCGSFKAKRVDSSESDEKAMEISDEWVNRDTERVVEDTLKKIQDHKGFKRYLRSAGKTPTVFIGEVKNLTSDAYFPINDINDEFLNELSASGDFILIDADAREAILKEITYQNDGMVDAKTAKKVGRQTGADLMIFGNVYMKPKTRKGKTIKEYAINIRMTNIEKGIEVLRTRAKLFKYSNQSSSGW